MKNRPGQRIRVMGIANDKAIVGRIEQFGSAIEGGGDDRQATSTCFEHHQGAGVVKGRVDEKVRTEKEVARVRCETVEVDTALDPQSASELLVAICRGTSYHDEPEGFIGGQPGHGTQQRVEALETIVHCHKERDHFIVSGSPSLPHGIPATELVRRLKARGIDSAVEDGHAIRRESEVLEEVLSDELAVGDDEGSRARQVLATFEQAKGAVRGIKSANSASEAADNGAAVLAARVRDGGFVQSSQGINHVDVKHLVEAE
jgi:hypothetical protein